MSLFFSYLYFIPPSYDKKGSFEFIRTIETFRYPVLSVFMLHKPSTDRYITYLYNNNEYAGELSYHYYFLPGVAVSRGCCCLYSLHDHQGQHFEYFQNETDTNQMLNMRVLHGIIQLLILMFLPNIGFAHADHARLLFTYFVFHRWYAPGGESGCVQMRCRTTLVTPGERRFVRIFTALCIVTCYAVWYLMEDAKAIGIVLGTESVRYQVHTLCQCYFFDRHISTKI